MAPQNPAIQEVSRPPHVAPRGLPEAPAEVRAGHPVFLKLPRWPQKARRGVQDGSGGGKTHRHN
eukprot:4842502-Pyramimonas_sp.AAC.1